MATNLIYGLVPGTSIYAATTDPATPNSGDPVVFGQLPGIALTDEGDGGNAATDTSIATTGTWSLSVVAVNNAGNTAVTAGDILYLDSGVVNKDVTNGVRFGYAMADITSGATATINVKIGY